MIPRPTHRDANASAPPSRSPLHGRSAGERPAEDVDARLAEAVARGDRTAFRQLYDRNIHRVLAQIGRMTGSGAHVEDIAQDVFVRVHQSLATFQFRSSFSSWLFGITHHTAVDWLRRERRPIDLEALRLLEQEPSALGQLEARQQMRILHAALNSLPLEAREAFVAHELEGLSLREIAELTETPLFTVAARVRRARQSLSSLLESTDGSRVAQGGRR